VIWITKSSEEVKSEKVNALRLRLSGLPPHPGPAQTVRDGK
jgi:hypothetical protein